MEKTSILKKGINCLLILIVSLATINTLTLIPTSSQQPAKTPKITIIPSSIEIGDENVKIGRVNKTYWKKTIPFTVKVNVSNVVDLFAWQVTIYYYPFILNCTGGRYPKGHVFEYEPNFIPVNATVHFVNFTIKTTDVDLENPVNTTWIEKEKHQKFNFTEWIDLDNSGSLSRFDAVRLVTGKNTSRLYFVQKMMLLPGDEVEITVLSGWVLFGASLLAGQTTFSGNGTLCELEFVGLYPGSSPLNFTLAETYILNSTLTKMPLEVSNAAVTVKGIPIKETSTITLDAFPTELKVGGNVTLTGKISPPTPKVNVTISYRTDSEWKTLKIIETDITGNFKYVWTTDKTGTYRLKASWQGDKYTEGAESEEVTVTVTAEEPTPKGFDPTLYIIIGVIVVIILVALLLYFKKFRS